MLVPTGTVVVDAESDTPVTVTVAVALLTALQSLLTRTQ